MGMGGGNWKKKCNGQVIGGKELPGSHWPKDLTNPLITNNLANYTNNLANYNDYYGHSFHSLTETWKWFPWTKIKCLANFQKGIVTIRYTNYSLLVN